MQYNLNSDNLMQMSTVQVNVIFNCGMSDNYHNLLFGINSPDTYDSL